MLGGNGARGQEAMEFFAALNLTPLPVQLDLPYLAEVASNVSKHLYLVSRRIGRLQQICGEDSVAHEARHLVWSNGITVLGHISKTANQDWPEKSRGTHRATACVSPYGFGFHNSLLWQDRRLRFLNSEYEGWDDPAKMAAAFFYQPRIPAHGSEFPEVAALLEKLFPKNEEVAERATRLWLVYRMKWVCIMLNEFFLADKARRGLSLGEEAQVKLRRQRLEAVGGSIKN